MNENEPTTTAEPTAESGKTEEAMVIATHDGPFHADDAFAVAVVRRLADVGLLDLRRFEPPKIVRTRDPDVLKSADIVVDVGGVYDTSWALYDHHQRGGAGERENGVPYAAFGLIWKAFGLSYVEGVVGGEQEQQEVVKKVDEMIVQSIDAADNGIQQGSGFTVSTVIRQMNPVWCLEPRASDFEAEFLQAVDLAISILDRAVLAAWSEVVARDKVLSALDEMHAAGRDFIVLDQYCEWLDVATADDTVQFVIFPNVQGTWMVQCVPPKRGSFEKRTPLREAWAGLPQETLRSVSGVDDAIFVHPAQFIGGAKTKEGAAALAERSLSA